MRRTHGKKLVLRKETLTALQLHGASGAARTVTASVFVWCTASECEGGCGPRGTQSPSVCVTLCNPSIPYESCICTG